jgi:hypothetical protein
VWREVLKADPDALVFQTPEWLDCVCDAGGYHDASHLYETPDGRQLIMPMVRRKRWPAALTTQASLPHSWGVGGIIAKGPIHSTDISAILSYLSAEPVMRTYIWPNPLAAETWNAARLPGIISVPRLAHVLDLTDGWEQIWTKHFRGSTRRQVRKAEKSQLAVECDTTGKLVPVFYDLFRQSVDRWADQQHEPRLLARWRARLRDPLHKIQYIAHTLGDACCIWVAWLAGQPAAAIVVLKGANADYILGAMDKELAASTGANALLHRLAIEDACLSGCRYYHMGESGPSASLARFKSGFGAKAYPYAEYRLERMPITSIDNQLRGLVKRLIGFKDA